jgi:RNase H-like domain found in reverse transcriptase
MFASRAVAGAESNYAPIEGEALAIIFALKRFEFLLRGHKVLIRTDHKPLTFIKSGCENNRKLARWWAEL